MYKYDNDNSSNKYFFMVQLHFQQRVSPAHLSARTNEANTLSS